MEGGGELYFTFPISTKVIIVEEGVVVSGDDKSVNSEGREPEEGLRRRGEFRDHWEILEEKEKIEQKGINFLAFLMKPRIFTRR